jgi:hypothetical protein
VEGWSEKSAAASGLQAAKNTTSQIVIVLDIENGKEINLLKSVESGKGEAPSNTYFLDSPDGVPNGTVPEDYIHTPIPTGLVFQNSDGHRKLVNPLTGTDVAVYDQQRVTSRLVNNEAGFYEYAYSNVMNSEGTPKAVATFGNFALVATSQPETRSKSGAYVQSSKYELVNTITKATVSEVVCAGNSYDPRVTSFSPNFRYVNFFGLVAVDTQSKAAFCANDVTDDSRRKLVISDIDNDGNLYARGDREFLRISLADQSKIETLAKDVSSDKELPIRITDKGSALLYSENSEDTLVAVPAKASTED